MHEDEGTMGTVPGGGAVGDASLASAADDAAPASAASGTEDGAPEHDPEASEADIAESEADLATVFERVLAEREQYLDALQRLKAEFENYRRRAQRETFEAGSRARAALLAEFLPVLDNLDRALSAAEHHEEGKVLEGVRLTHNLFADLLRKEGVVELDALGLPFDPTVHEALVAQPSGEHEEGTVTAVIERGYGFGDRVLRPAKVVVSSGPNA